MASYNYDESGAMAMYFLITFLALILVPLSLSQGSRSKRRATRGCDCGPCIKMRERTEKHGLVPTLTAKTAILLLGWPLIIYLIYAASTRSASANKIYNPFEILGLATSTSEKDIKSHFKKLSKQYHPDKVRATANETLEMIQDRFVEITKAYKSLTDVVIRENWIQYGHPDGRQELSMGIALPKWIIEGKNNIWVLGVYGLLFGGALPALVGRWWFGSRGKTKDGIQTRSASAFFRSIREESGMAEVIAALGKVYTWEHQPRKHEAELDELEKKIEKGMWDDITFAFRGDKRALILLYAHMLRLEITSADLKEEQTKLLLQTPALLNAYLNVTTVRGWIQPTLCIMRLHAYLAQALPPMPADGRLRIAQLPNVARTDEIPPDVYSVEQMVDVLEKTEDARQGDVKKALQHWGRLDVVDVSFRVIGERVITPSSFIIMLVKLRIVPPTGTPTSIEHSDPAREEKFLLAKGDSEDIGLSTVETAHAPYWPAARTPGWWLYTIDEQKNRVIIAPMRLVGIPADPAYRMFKVQFQAPANVGTVQWKLCFVSDTYVGEEDERIVSFQIEEPAVVQDGDLEDDISEPDEDTIAGQMAAIRGGKVKRAEESDDDDSSGTDEEENSESDSDSD